MLSEFLIVSKKIGDILLVLKSTGNLCRTPSKSTHGGFGGGRWAYPAPLTNNATLYPLNYHWATIPCNKKLRCSSQEMQLLGLQYL